MSQADLDDSAHAALRRLAAMAARGASPREALCAVAAEAAKAFGADLAIVLRCDPDGTVTVVGRWSGPDIEVPADVNLGVAGLDALEAGRPGRSDGSAGPPGSFAAFLSALGARASVAAPITVEGALWGAVVAAIVADCLPDDAEARLGDLTELLTPTVANADAREHLRRSANDYAALRRVGTLVTRGAAPADVFSAVAHGVRDMLGSDHATIVRFEDDEMATFVASAGWSGEVGQRYELAPPMPADSTRRTGRPARVGDLRGAPEWVCELVKRWGVRSSVSVPIFVGEHVWGDLNASSGSEPLAADAEQRMLDFAGLVATAIVNAQARDELRRVSDQQAALRRVAMRVAHGAPPANVFAAVTDEVRELLGADFASLMRFEADATATLLAGPDSVARVIGERWKLVPPTVDEAVFRTGRPARADDYSTSSTEVRENVRRLGIRSSVAAPIVVGGQLWGVVSATTRSEPLPGDAEQRMLGFAELAATALANAEDHAALIASRARIVAASDQARRRIERDLHDGVQQHLTALALTIGSAAQQVPAELPELQATVSLAADRLNSVFTELQEIARGIHPGILSHRGLAAALRTLARRSAIPVELSVPVAERLPEHVEVAAYYVVAEALANVAKHAHASSAAVEVSAGDGWLRLCVRDDGIGGVDPRRGSGLIGLTDRVEALGGMLSVHSSPGNGTSLQVSLPLH